MKTEMGLEEMVRGLMCDGESVIESKRRELRDRQRLLQEREMEIQIAEKIIREKLMKKIQTFGAYDRRLFFEGRLVYLDSEIIYLVKFLGEDNHPNAQLLWLDKQIHREACERVAKTIDQRYFRLGCCFSGYTLRYCMYLDVKI